MKDRSFQQAIYEPLFNKEMKVSIVIPTYKRPALLSKCLNRLVLQKFPKQDYEIIVISDGPDAITEKVIQRFQQRDRFPLIKFSFLPNKQGPAAARNKGWRMALGQLIAFTDDDCMPGIYWISAYWITYILEDEKVFTGRVTVPLPPCPTDYERNISQLGTADFVTANCCCTRTALEAVNGFDERFSTAWREDSDLEFNFLQKNMSILYVDAAWVIHPAHPANWGVSLKEQRKSMFNALLYKKHPRLYKEKIQSAPPWHYYAAILFVLFFFLNILFLRSYWVAVISLVCWIAIIGRFILKRLNGNSLKPRHLFEIAVTSLLIPFLSVFWRIYGGFKFKVFFI